MMYDYIGMGNRMLFARMKNKTKQKTIAAALGITQPSYSNIERGNTEVTINQLHIIAELLHVPAVWLMGYDVNSGLTDEEALKVEEFKRYLISQRKN